MRKFLPIIFILHCVSAAPLLATTRTVTNLNDAGAGSLRQRIVESAANDTINFSVTGTITLTTAELLINKNLTISGPGATVLTVRRSAAGGTPFFRIFRVAFGNFNVSISGLTIVNGNSSGIYNDSAGGGIYSATTGTATIANSTISGNTATDGGGIYFAATGTVTITNSTISGNTASNGNGGGILNQGVGTVNFTNSTISGNTASGSAGGIFNYGGTLSITNTAISANTAPNGCGIYNNGGGTVTMINSTISHNTTTTSNVSFGGGIWNDIGTVTLTSSRISDNSATSGGGVSNNSTLNLINSTISNNSGGGVSNNGTLNLTDSTISGNTALDGGGIANGNGTVTITNSTVSNNSANSSNGDGVGGGIINGGNGTVNLTNSTVSNNSCSTPTGALGGGIYSSGTVNLTNCTISGNSLSGGASRTAGGGIFVSDNTTATIKNTIIAKNSAPEGPDASGAMTSNGFNLIGDNSDSTIPPAAGDQIGTPGAPIDPLLGQLADNGGPTKTQALLSGSPAINNGDPNTPSRDQRGYIRPDTADMGAFEFEAAVPVTLANISTRAVVQTGNNVLIAGIIITGGNQKSVIVRALGPTLGQPPFNLPGVLADPTIELRDSTGALITANDNWGDAPNSQAITDSGYAPPNSLESAMLTTLNPGNYTAIVRGVNNGTGIALVEVYDLDDPTTASKLGNISTRAFVQTGNNVMIAGVIVHGPDTENVIIRGLGPTLGQAPFNVPNALQDPTLELRDVNGNLIRSNDNWKDTQQTEIQASGYAPPNGLESAISAALAPSNYTAILRGKNNATGNALVEVYSLN